MGDPRPFKIDFGNILAQNWNMFFIRCGASYQHFDNLGIFQKKLFQMAVGSKLLLGSLVPSASCYGMASAGCAWREQLLIFVCLDVNQKGLAHLF